MTNKTEAESIAELSQKPLVEHWGGIPHLLLPDSIHSTPMEHLLPAPVRIKGQYTLEHPESLARYIDEFKEAGTRLFAAFDRYRFLAIINGHTLGNPSHGDHRVSLAMTFSKEWQAWVAGSGHRFKPREFAIFLENHLREITGAFTGSDLLAMCRALRVSVNGGMQADEVVNEGRRSLLFSMNTTLRGQHPSGSPGVADVAFPETLQITLPVFNHVAPFIFEPRLRWDASDSGVVFSYDLIDAEIVQRAAFAQVVAEVEAITGLRAFIGAPNN